MFLVRLARKNYALAFLTLLSVEFAIAFWVHDRFIRPFIGDLLVVVVIYALLQAIFLFPARRAATGVLLFAFVIEALQAIDYAALLGVEHLPWASVLLGRTFSWWDFVAYSAGYAILWLDPRARQTLS